jgi:hypothetical protein
MVEGGIGGVAATTEGVKEHVAGDFPGQPRSQRAVFSRIPGLFGPRRRHRFNLLGVQRLLSDILLCRHSLLS